MRTVSLSIAALAAAACFAQHAACAPVPAGSGRFVYRAPDGSTMDVWTYLPARCGADVPVLFVLHGTNRNAGEYRDAWVEHAERVGLLLLVPEFTKRAYPSGEGYQQLGAVTAQGEPRPEPQWATGRIEAIFDHVVMENRLVARSYCLYGHSAGGQFVHRMMLLAPHARVSLALPANPGWYTLPTFEAAYPQGLEGIAVSEAGLRASLGKNVVLLLGGADTDPHHPHLPRNRAARQQGPHRLARGRFFYTALEAEADALGATLRWRVHEVPGVGHSNAGMARVAAQEIEAHLQLANTHQHQGPSPDGSVTHAAAGAADPLPSDPVQAQ